MTAAAQSGFAHLALVFCCRDQNSDEIKATAHFSAEQLIRTRQKKTYNLEERFFFFFPLQNQFYLISVMGWVPYSVTARWTKRGPFKFHWSRHTKALPQGTTRDRSHMDGAQRTFIGPASS